MQGAELSSYFLILADILKFVEKRVKGRASIHSWITHTHVFEIALALKEELRAHFNWKELRLLELGPVLGTHIGPGFFGVGFYNEQDWQLDQY